MSGPRCQWQQPEFWCEAAAIRKVGSADGTLYAYACAEHTLAIRKALSEDRNWSSRFQLSIAEQEARAYAALVEVPVPD